jgi:hypothetical protein
MEEPIAKPRSERVRTIRKLTQSPGKRAGSDIENCGLGRSFQSKAQRQLELYQAKLQILKRELAGHRSADRHEAAQETLSSLRMQNALIRQLCQNSSLDLPPEVPADD